MVAQQSHGRQAGDDVMMVWLARHLGLDELPVVELAVPIDVHLTQHFLDLVLRELVAQRPAQG